MNDCRKKTIQLIQCDFACHLDEKQVANLEKGIYNSSIDECKKRNFPINWESPVFNHIYDATVRRTILDISQKTHLEGPCLLDRLKSGEFEVQQIPFMNFPIVNQKPLELKLEEYIQ
jgi:hypothetical protein